jgi:WASH complex subunit strumpellin
MGSIVVGGIEVNPHKLLDDGLRKELVLHVSELLNNLIQFDFSADSETVSTMSKHLVSAMRSLASLSGRLDAFQSCLECVDDYLCMHGLKMWHEEMGRIISYNVEQEVRRGGSEPPFVATTSSPHFETIRIQVNKYLLRKILDSDSKFQSDIVPIPRFPRTINEPSCLTFMGRMVSMLIKISDAQYTTYSLERNGWFMRDERAVCGLNTISLIRDAIGVYGLSGLDRLLCYRALHELHRFVKFFRTNVSKQGVLLEQLRDEVSSTEFSFYSTCVCANSSFVGNQLFPEWRTPKDAVAIYAAASKKTEMLMLPMLTCFRRVGQAQLLRRMVRFELQRCANADAKLLKNTICTYNTMMDANQSSEGTTEDVRKMCDLTVSVGAGDPMQTVFLKTDPLEGLPVLLLVFIITYTQKLTFNPAFGSLSKVKAGYPIDGWPIIAGISTLVKQFHPSYGKSFLAYLGQFIRVSVTEYTKGGNEDATRLAADSLRSCVVLAEQFCDISGLSRSALYEHVPQYVFELCGDLPSSVVGT